MKKINRQNKITDYLTIFKQSRQQQQHMSKIEQNNIKFKKEFKIVVREVKSELKVGKKKQKSVKKKFMQVLKELQKDHKQKEKEAKQNKPSVITEAGGKKFEKSICSSKNIEYDSKFKYDSQDDLKEIDEMTERLNSSNFHNVVSGDIVKHIAKNGSQHDFELTNIDEFTDATGNIIRQRNTSYLSAKTSKTKIGKVCPQVIGQRSKKRFCDYFKLNNESTTTDDIKLYIVNNSAHMLHEYFKYTFDCPILYYNRKINKIIYVTLTKEIDWYKEIVNIYYSHVKKNKKWNESTQVYLHNKTIGEYQVHNHRDCIKFRWYFETLLDLFKENFNIITIE